MHYILMYYILTSCNQSYGSTPLKPAPVYESDPEYINCG